MKLKTFTQKELKTLILATIKDVGETSIDEIFNHLQVNDIDTDRATVVKLVRQLHAGKILAEGYYVGQIVYKIASIKPWYASLDMAGLMEDKSALKDILKDLDADIKTAEGGNTGGSNQYTDFTLYETKIELIDPVLGGRPTDEKGRLALPRVRGQPVITAQQIRAWFRDNLAIVNLPRALHRWIAFSDLMPTEDVETQWLIARGAPGTGFQNHEAFKEGTQFTYKMRIPHKARSVRRSVESIVQLFEVARDMPLRGLGSNPFVYGGKFKLISMTPSEG